MSNPDSDPRPHFVRVGRPAHVVTLHGEPTTTDPPVPPEPQRKLPRVGPPAVQASVTFEPVVPIEGPIVNDPLIRVQGPALPVVKLMAEIVEPDTPPLSRGRLIRVQGPALPVVKLTAHPAESVNLELAFPVASAEEGGAMLDNLTVLIDRLNVFEVSLGGQGVTWDQERSKAENGSVTLVLVPNNPVGAAERLTAIAQIAAMFVELAGGTSVRAELEPVAA